MKIIIFFPLFVIGSILNCKNPRKFFRIAKAAVIECSDVTNVCKVQCQFGVRPEHPDEFKCEKINGKWKWNFPARTQVFCNQEALASASTTAVPAPTTTSAPAPSTTTATVVSSMTGCGDINNHYFLPKEINVNCNISRCQLTCSNGGRAVPNVVKCFPNKNKWRPRQFSKVMCLGGSKPEVEAINAGSSVQMHLSGGQQQAGSVLGNGFFGFQKNTKTDCGDMKKKKFIKLAFGVNFDCKKGGCTYSCQNPLQVPNIPEGTCSRLD